LNCRNVGTQLGVYICEYCLLKFKCNYCTETFGAVSCIRTVLLVVTWFMNVLSNHKENFSDEKTRKWCCLLLDALEDVVFYEKHNFLN
jgi:hypothetical protein